MKPVATGAGGAFTSPIPPAAVASHYRRCQSGLIRGLRGGCGRAGCREARGKAGMRGGGAAAETQNLRAGAPALGIRPGGGCSRRPRGCGWGRGCRTPGMGSCAWGGLGCVMGPGSPVQPPLLSEGAGNPLPSPPGVNPCGSSPSGKGGEKENKPRRCGAGGDRWFPGPRHGCVRKEMGWRLSFLCSGKDTGSPVQSHPRSRDGTGTEVALQGKAFGEEQGLCRCGGAGAGRSPWAMLSLV